MFAEQISKDSDKEKNETIKIVKSFLNSINDNIYILTNNGYDTKDVYLLYDMLRYELLTEEQIEALYLNNKTDELIKKINVFDNLFKSLTDELSVNEKKKDKIENKINNYAKATRNRTDLEEYDRIDILKASLAVLLTSASILVPSYGVFFANKLLRKAPETTTIEVDTENKYNSSVDYYHYGLFFENNSIIEEYLPVDESGHRIKKTYILNDKNIINIKNSDDLSKIDLSSITPSSETIVFDEEVNNKSTDVYRRVTYREINNEIHKSGKLYDGYAIFEYCVTLIIIIFISMFIIISLQSVLKKVGIMQDALYFIEDIYDHLITITKYKIALKKYLNKLNLLEKEKQKYEKITNTLCSRIDKLILQTTEAVAEIENNSEQSKKVAAEKAEKKFKKIANENIDNKKKIIDSINDLSKILSQELSKLDSLDEEEYESLLHSIQIKEKLLFEEKDGHLVIRSMFLPILAFFDLSKIDFDNVDVRYIDFSNTNAVVQIQKVFQKDLSFATFCDDNIINFSDYTGINLTGTKLQETPGSMINLKEAVVSEETIFRKKKTELL